MMLLWSGHVVAQDIEFTFAPPDGTRGAQTVSETRNLYFEDGRQSVEEVVRELDFVYQADREGVLLTETTAASRIGVETNPVVGQVFDALEGLSVQYRLTTGGQLIDIQGLDQVATRLQASFPDDMADRLASVFNEDVLLVSAAADWTARIGLLAGQKLSLTQPIYGRAEHIMPTGGPLRYFTASQVLYAEGCPTGRCVRVLTVFDSDQFNIRDLLAAAVSGDTKAAAAQPLSLNDAAPAIRGSNFRLIDPTTMLIYDELNLSTIRSVHQVPGQPPMQLLTGERQQYNYVYY